MSRLSMEMSVSCNMNDILNFVEDEHEAVEYLRDFLQEQCEHLGISIAIVDYYLDEGSDYDDSNDF